MMDFKRFLTIGCLLILLSSCFSCCSYINHFLGLENDNILEELVEAKIEAETGLKFDLTPED